MLQNDPNETDPQIANYGAPPNPAPNPPGGNWFDANHPSQLVSSQAGAQGNQNLPPGASGNGSLNASDPTGPTQTGAFRADLGGGDLAAGTPGNTGFNFGQPPPTYQSSPWTGGAPPVYQQPGMPPPTFTAPTGITEQNDPGYQARLDAGNQGIQRSAAAAGNVLSGGTLKALARYNQDYASNEFQNVYNRAQGTFGAQNTTYGNTMGAAQTQFQNANTTAQNQYGMYLGENARTLNDYNTNVNTQRNAQNDYWSQLFGLSGQGLNAASQGQGA